MPDTNRAREVEDSIRQVLLHDWDPTGVAGEPLAEHAYDSYIGQVHDLVARGASAPEIADYLSEESGRMGVAGPDRSTLLSVAGKLKALDVRLRDTGATELQPQPWAEAHPTLVGLGTLLVLHALVMLGPLQGMTPMKGAAEPFFIGVVQLWYVLPLGVVFYLVGWRRTLKVFAIGAVITFVLNLAACAVFVSIMKDIGK